MSIRNDYVFKHSGVCLSCQSKGNSFAKKHGGYKTRLYKIWLGLKHRRYENYNPKVCDEWKDFSVFRELALSNGYSDNLTIDRIDNKGDYEPTNCQWITIEENAGKDKLLFTNEQGKELFLERKDLKITQREMAKKLGVSRNTIQRLEKRAKEELYGK